MIRIYIMYWLLCNYEVFIVLLIQYVIPRTVRLRHHVLRERERERERERFTFNLVSTNIS